MNNSLKITNWLNIKKNNRTEWGSRKNNLTLIGYLIIIYQYN